jgi:hypothetical protein
LNILVDEYDFLSELQVQQESTDANVDVNMRIAFKTEGKKEPISQLTQEFVLTVKGDELTSVTENECADVTISTEFAERCPDYSLSFQQWDDLEIQEVLIHDTFVVEPSLLESFDHDCEVRYVLRVYHQETQEYIPLVDFADKLREATTDGHLVSEIIFDETTGDVEAYIANHEVTAFKDDFFVDPAGRRLLTDVTAYAI